MKLIADINKNLDRGQEGIIENFLKFHGRLMKYNVD